jgi:hypothetical protein
MTNRSQPTKADLAFQSRMEKLSRRLHQTPNTTNRNQNATTTLFTLIQDFDGACDEYYT